MRISYSVWEHSNMKTIETFQDQLHIDLFVFFSVFFSCFFLFLSGTRIITLGLYSEYKCIFVCLSNRVFPFFPACVVLWKLKQMGDLRRARNKMQLFKFSVPSLRTFHPSTQSLFVPSCLSNCSFLPFLLSFLHSSSIALFFFCWLNTKIAVLYSFLPFPPLLCVSTKGLWRVSSS